MFPVIPVDRDDVGKSAFTGIWDDVRNYNISALKNKQFNGKFQHVKQAYQIIYKHIYNLFLYFIDAPEGISNMKQSSNILNK